MQGKGKERKRLLVDFRFQSHVLPAPVETTTTKVLARRVSPVACVQTSRISFRRRRKCETFARRVCPQVSCAFPVFDEIKGKFTYFNLIILCLLVGSFQCLAKSLTIMDKKIQNVTNTSCKEQVYINICGLFFARFYI